MRRPLTAQGHGEAVAGPWPATKASLTELRTRDGRTVKAESGLSLGGRGVGAPVHVLPRPGYRISRCVTVPGHTVPRPYAAGSVARVNSQVTDDPEATLPTRIAMAMLKAAADHPECHDGVRLVVLVSDVTASGAEASAICGNGFPDDDGGAELLATVATGVAMLFEVHGIEVKFARQPLMTCVYPPAPAAGRGMAALRALRSACGQARERHLARGPMCGSRG